MGPKKKGGQKKGKEKKGKEKKNEPLKQKKSQYLERIADMNATLAQVRKATYDAEELYFITEKKHEQVQEDLADVIKYLQGEIKACEEEILTYDIGIEKHRKEIQAQNDYYNKIFIEMDEEFEHKKRDITEKIESMSAKLNSFEEVRRRREEYLRRKKILDDLLAEMSLRHKKEIYEAEKQAIIEQDRLQKDMEMRLHKLALDFREATDVRIGETTNRIIRENIKLGNKLTCQQDLFKKTMDDHTKMKDIQRHANFDLELKQDEYNLAFEKYSDSSNKIEALLQIVDELTRKIEDLKRLVKVNRRIKRKITELECYNKDLSDELATLVRSLEEIEEQATRAKGNLHYFQNIILKLQTSLFEIAKKVKDAIECENISIEEIEAARTASEEETDKVGDLSEVEEMEKEKMYRQREALAMEIVSKLQSEISDVDELHLAVPSIDSYDVNFGYRSSIELNPSTKRSEFGENVDNEEIKIFDQN